MRAAIQGRVLLTSRFAGLAVFCMIVLLLHTCTGNSSVGHSPAENPASENTPKDNGRGCTIDNEEDVLLEWFRSKGGYWNSKQALGCDQNGVLGVFAMEAIEEGELLASVPWDVVLGYGSSRYKNCGLVRLLSDEMNKVDGNFAVFASRLKASAAEHSGLLPAFWSPQGQALLNEVLGNGMLPPQDVFMKASDWKRTCAQIDKEAAVLVMTHGEGFGMVPVVNRYNNGGGSQAGARFSDYWKTGDAEVALKIKASRTLQAGEQILFDYKKDMGGAYSTPDLLRDYGFVESYPQRYVFDNIRFAFEVDKTDDTYTVTWRKEFPGDKTKYMGYPDETAISFLGGHLLRLQKLYPTLKEHQINVPKHEMETIIHFCRDMITAIERAILDFFVNAYLTVHERT